MSLRINTNIAALDAHRQLQNNDDMLNKSLQRLSSGLRINSAADDAAGLAITERMKAQVNGLDQAQRNAQDGISMLQTAEGALSTSQTILQRMRQLAVEAANDTLTTADRSNLAVEMNQLSSELDRIANNTDFNTKKLLDGSLATGGLTFQIGATAGQIINLTIATASSTALTVSSGNIDVSSAGSASTTITNIDSALNIVSTQRAQLGAYMSRLQNTISNLGIQSENVSSARSRVADLDMAAEVVSMSKSQILTQSATAMLSQANQSSQGVLSLLRGG
jgi:flagellin